MPLNIGWVRALFPVKFFVTGAFIIHIMPLLLCLNLFFHLAFCHSFFFSLCFPLSFIDLCDLCANISDDVSLYLFIYFCPVTSLSSLLLLTVLNTFHVLWICILIVLLLFNMKLQQSPFQYG